MLGLDSDGKLNLTRSRRTCAARHVGGGPGRWHGAYDAAEKHFRANRTRCAGQLLGAMSGATDPALAARSRALVFEEGLLRRNEIFAAVGGQTGDDATRPALREWIDVHFSELEAKLAPAGSALVSLYSADMCSTAEASALQDKFGKRRRTSKAARVS